MRLPDDGVHDIDWLYKYVYESSGQYSRLAPLLSYKENGA